MENILKGKNLAIILNTPITSKSMSGGDKIFIKISEILVKKHNFKVTFIGCPEGIKLVKNSTKVNFKYISLNNISGENRNIFLTYFLRLIIIFKVFFIKIKPSYIISASDFITDTIPLFLLKIRFRNRVKCFSSMFLRKEFSQIKCLRDLFFYISQNITLSLSKIFGISIFTNLIDLNFLISKGFSKRKLKILPGGIDKFNLKNLPKKYDSCFVGRISHQKGLDKLLIIWKEAVKIKSDIKLSLIVSGTDAEISDLKSEISLLGLSKNIEFLGFLDNKKKYEVIQQSKILLFPSRYESFGIVVSEALNLEVPVISFELEALKLNYSAGILYSRDNSEFLKNIFLLLNNPILSENLGKEGKKAVKYYSWENIANKFLIDLV